jgi:predicted Zn-dependent protease
MLFDTQSPGRRKFVQVIFFSMAVLMGLGLVLFGIGSAVSGGGLADIFTGNNGADISSASKQSEKDAEKAEKALTANPKDVEAAEDLATARLVIATNDAFNPTTGEAIADQQQLITDATNAWTKYIALAPAKPSAGLGIQYATLFAAPGVNDYAKAARALQTVLAVRKPTAGLYAQLAIYSLAAGQADNYKEARARALALTTTAERRKEIADSLDKIEASIKKQTKDAQAAQAAQGDDSGAATTPKLQTLPTLR